MSYAKMMGTMRRNPHCFGHSGHGKDGDPLHTHERKKKVTISKGTGDPLDDLPKSSSPRRGPVYYNLPGTPTQGRLVSPRGNQFPGAGKKKGKKPVLINRPPQPRAGGGRRHPGPDDWKRKDPIVLKPGDGSPLGPNWEPPKEPTPKSHPGPGARVPPVLRPGTGPYNPNQRRSRPGGRGGLSPMQRRNEQGLRRVKAR